MSIHCTEAEWKIMEVLWESAPRPMPELTRILEPQTGWSRHTVITLLKRMQEKGAVAVDETGPVKTYTPLIKRENAVQQQTKKLINHVFSGRASLLVQNLVDTGEITVKEVEELLSMIRERTPEGGE